MSGFLHRGDPLGRELRSARPRPSEELVSRIEGRLRDVRPVTRRGSLRLAIPVALTVTMVGALAAVGGVSYAASSVAQAAKEVAHVFVPAKQHKAVAVESLNAGHDQYRPGYGWGDPNHTHTGPPGLVKKGGAFAPPLLPTLKGPTALVSTSFTLDEQAHLTFSVFDAKTHKKLLLTQTKSRLGNGITGRQTKNIQYLMLVPRTIPLKLAIPANLVTPGSSYYIRIRARSPLNEVKFLRIPIRG
jgi:hypothetical protein